MPEGLSADAMRTMLHVLHEVSGPQYDRLLKQAGLARYLAGLPADWTPAGSGAELTQLFATVYEMLGEPLTRLFFRNCGLVFATAMREGPRGRALLLRTAAAPPEDRLGVYLHVAAAANSRAWSTQTVTEDATSYYLTLDLCYFCAGIHGVQAPICAAGEALHRSLAEDVMGHRVRVVEIECAAMGAPHCKYAFDKS